MKTINQLGYSRRFLGNQNLLLGMNSAFIDTLKFKHISQTIKNKSVLKSFAANPSGGLEITKYSSVKTITGRMTVKSGPQILTAPKEIRGALKSRYRNGKIIEVDYTSLEPRLGVAIAGNTEKIPVDVYDFFSANVFNEKIDRQQCKLAVLSAMYGAGSRTLQNLLPAGFSSKEVILKLREKLNFHEVVSNARDQCEQTGFMVNYYGRPIFPDGARDALIYNYYIQSSAVDAALSGFNWLIDQIREYSGKTAPIFLIHDAMILDVPAEELNRIQEIINKGLCVDSFGFFPAKINFLEN